MIQLVSVLDSTMQAVLPGRKMPSVKCESKILIHRRNLLPSGFSVRCQKNRTV